MKRGHIWSWLTIAVCIVGLAAIRATNVAAVSSQSFAWEARSYSALGHGPTGESYTATVDLTKHGAVYEVTWTFPQGDSMSGVGLVEGDRLVIGFVGGSMLGTGVYRVHRSAPLTIAGQWTWWGEERLYDETWTEGPPPIRAEAR